MSQRLIKLKFTSILIWQSFALLSEVVIVESSSERERHCCLMYLSEHSVFGSEVGIVKQTTSCRVQSMKWAS